MFLTGLLCSSASLTKRIFARRYHQPFSFSHQRSKVACGRRYSYILPPDDNLRRPDVCLPARHKTGLGTAMLPTLFTVN
jgi:hypothetical protein